MTISKKTVLTVAVPAALVAAAVLFLPQGILGLFQKRKATKVPQANTAATDELSIDDPAIALIIRETEDLPLVPTT